MSNRGINAETDFALTLDFNEIGNSWINQTYRYPRHISQRPPQLRQPCRGTRPIPAPSGTESEQVVLSKQAQESAQIHLNNICRLLERRLQVAQSRGDNHLVNLLKNEYQQIDCQ